MPTRAASPVTNYVTSRSRTARSLHPVLDLAVRDRRLPASPAKGVKLPPKLPKVRRFLTAAQVEALVVECEPYGLVVRFLAYSGLRWGEMAPCGSATSTRYAGACSSPGR